MNQVTVTEAALDGVARLGACSWGNCGLRANCGTGALGGARWVRLLLPGSDRLAQRDSCSCPTP